MSFVYCVNDFSLFISGLNTIEITANGMLVLLAGYDTTAILMSMLLYTLAVEQEIQEKLFNEIQDITGEKVYNYGLIETDRFRFMKKLIF